MSGVRIASVVALVLLAGCGGAADPTPTATPAPVPATERVSLPPGVEDGDVNATALAAAHRRATARRSYTLVVLDRRRIGGQELGARFAGTRRVVRVAGDRYRTERASLSSRAALSASVVERETYGDGSWSYVREVTRNGTRYRVRPAAPRRHAAFGATLVSRYLAVENVSVTPTGDGGARLRGTAPTAVNGTYYSVEATVGPDGFVRRLHAEYLLPDGTPRFLTVTYRRVGATTVDRPGWVDDADAAANATEN